MAGKTKKTAVRASASMPTKTTPKFRDLSPTEQKRVAGTIIGTMKRIGIFAKGGYKTVYGPDQHNRAWTSPETKGEDFQLNASERNRLIALARNAARNSERLEGILHQMEVNIIGTEGGKAIFSFPAGYENAETQIREAFAEWAQEAEYFDDLNLQETLRLILRTQLIGGDIVLVFDWDITKADSGQIIAFEPDCVGNLAGFKDKFPNFTQHSGIIKNENGKTVGVVVSWAQRGQTEYALDIEGKRSAWTLLKPEGLPWRDSPFIIFRGLSRFNQMRGSSRLWPALGSVVDMSDGQGYEMQSMKKNAQTLAQVTQQQEENDGEIAAELDPDASAPVADLEEIQKEAEEAASEAEKINLDLDAIAGAGTIYDVLPPGVKMELLDTKHPNINLVEFSKWLHGGVGFALGLGNVHAQGKSDSSYSAAMAEMLLSDLSFKDEFHKLETGFLDWVLSNWSRRAQSMRLIPQDSQLPPYWRRTCVKWSKPPKRSINPVDEQKALAEGLRNGTILYRDVYGPDWKAVMERRAEEREALKALNLPYLPEQTASGAIVPSGDGDGNDNKNETEKENNE